MNLTDLCRQREANKKTTEKRWFLLYFVLTDSKLQEMIQQHENNRLKLIQTRKHEREAEELITKSNGNTQKNPKCF